MYARKYEQALPLLERCFHAQPFRSDYAQVLANCQLQLQMLDEADKTIDQARGHFGRTENADLIKASIAIEREDFTTALELLDGVKDKFPEEVQIQLFLARCYAALRRWQEGYWEWEEIKQLPKNPRLIEQTKGKVVKVISALLPSLPRPHRYKIIYMVRPTTQVVDSQLVMLDRQGQKARSEKQHLIEVQEAHSKQIREVLRNSEAADLLEVSYPDLVSNPNPIIEQLKEFLGDRFHASDSIAACIKPQLFRNR